MKSILISVEYFKTAEYLWQNTNSKCCSHLAKMEESTSPMWHTSVRPADAWLEGNGCCEWCNDQEQNTTELPSPSTGPWMAQLRHWWNSATASLKTLLLVSSFRASEDRIKSQPIHVRCHLLGEGKLPHEILKYSFLD